MKSALLIAVLLATSSTAPGAPLRVPAPDPPEYLQFVPRLDPGPILLPPWDFSFEIPYPETPRAERPDPPAASLLCAGLALSTIGLRRKIRKEHRPNCRKRRDEARLLAQI